MTEVTLFREPRTYRKRNLDEPEESDNKRWKATEASPIISGDLIQQTVHPEERYIDVHEQDEDRDQEMWDGRGEAL